MWKIVVAFIAFAALALFVIMKGGDKIDMQGEAGHGGGSTTTETTPAPSTPVTPAPSPSPATPESQSK